MSSLDKSAMKHGPAEGPLLLKPENGSEKSEHPWKVLIVDDEPEVHSVTRLALSDFRFNGRELDFISAHSGSEAQDILRNDPEIAVMLLDVVMETDDAGLLVVQYVRQTLGNHFLRIVLRTGHPGVAPERRIIQAYDINDYRAKTELTQDRMFSLMYTSLAAYERMTSLARSRRFLRTVADEYKDVLERITARLNGPTEALMAASQQIRQSVILKQDERADAALCEIERQCDAIQQTAAALRHLGGMATDDAPQQQFSANAAVDEALARLAEMCSARGAKVTVEDLPDIYGYPRLFVDLFEHLLSNAIKFQPGDAPNVDVSVASRGNDWQFSVADRGPGVPPDQCEAIFQAFNQIDGTGKNGGVGMGLAVCRKIVARHGGRMWVTPRSGGGACFQFTIPAGATVHDDG